MERLVGAVSQMPCVVPDRLAPSWNGYSQISWDSPTGRWLQQGHVLAARVFHRGGAPLGDDEQVHHTCENRRCINPLHLQIKTREEHHRLHWERRRKAA